MSVVLAGQGARAHNGCRVTDGDDPRQTDPTRPRPCPPTVGAEPTGSTGGTTRTWQALVNIARPSSGSDIEAALAAWRDQGEGEGAPLRKQRDREGVPEGAPVAYGGARFSNSWVTCSDKDEEEPPRRRRRTAAETREAAARHRAARVLRLR